MKIQLLSQEIKLLDLSNMSTELSHIYSPRVLLNLCLGFLKLSELDPSLALYLKQKQMKSVTRHKSKVQDPTKKQSTIKSVIEEWLESDSPYENESGRIMVKFISKIGIGNSVLLEWVTSRNVVYLKCSDMLLGYISQHWSEPIVEDEPESEQEEDMLMTEEIDETSG